MIRILRKSNDSQRRSILFKQYRHKQDSNNKIIAADFCYSKHRPNVEEGAKHNFPEEHNQYNSSTNIVQQRKTSPLNVSWQQSLPHTKN